MKKKLFVLLIPLVLIIISLVPRKENKDLVSNTDNLVSFTVDGVESKTMPTKGSGYIANKITCKNGSIITFDNDNYIIEVEKLESDDVCKIDFSKEIGSNTVTVTISDTSKIDSTSKTTTEGGKVMFYLTGKPDSITGGEYTLSSNKLIVNNIISSINLNITMSKTLYDQLLIDNSTIKTRTDFNTTFTETNTGTLYKATESIAGNTPKDVYYFAGDAKNNWVKFGKNASNQDLYWRIIRTNADGSVRLLYHSTSTAATNAYIGTSAFNTTYNNSMYVSYMYGTSGAQASNRTNENSSTIKTAIDNWYVSNLEAKGYTKYLSTTAVYCNDREVGSGTYSATGSAFYYAAYARLNTNKTPSYDCAATEDKFTVDNSTGNGKLTYPIALMTADEVSFAGGVYGTNAPTWYYYNSANGSSTGSTWWWSLSPSYWSGGSARVFRVGGSSYPGNLGYNDVDYTRGVRPVISLKSCIKYSTGNGAPETPYEIVLDPDISC